MIFSTIAIFLENNNIIIISIPSIFGSYNASRSIHSSFTTGLNFRLQSRNKSKWCGVVPSYSDNILMMITWQELTHVNQHFVSRWAAINLYLSHGTTFGSKMTNDSVEQKHHLPSPPFPHPLVSTLFSRNMKRIPSDASGIHKRWLTLLILKPYMNDDKVQPRL